MTGSITFAISGWEETLPATASMAETSGSIPVFIARMEYTPSTASSCAATKSAGTAWIPETPDGFFAVRDVKTVQPWRPYAWNARRSAWTPALPPESDPATVRQHGAMSRIAYFARPRAHVDRDLAFGERADGDGWRGRLQHAGDGEHRLADHVERPSDVLAVGYADLHVYAARRHRAVVHDGASPDGLVGHDDLLVVASGERRRHYVHLNDRTLEPRDLDEVPDLERLVQCDHQPGRQVAQRLLERKAEDEAGDAEARHERRHVHAQPPEHHDEKDGPARLSHRRRDEVDQQPPALAPRKPLADCEVHQADHKPSHDEKHKRAYRVLQQAHPAAREPFAQLVHCRGHFLGFRRHIGQQHDFSPSV